MKTVKRKEIVECTCTSQLCGQTKYHLKQLLIAYSSSVSDSQVKKGMLAIFPSNGFRGNLVELMVLGDKKIDF